MSKHTLVVFDADQNLWTPNAELSAKAGPNLAGAGSWSIKHHRLQGGPSDGVDVIEMDNGAFSVSIVPTRGMGLWKARYKDIFLGWDSPVKQLVHPHLVDLNDRNGLGWLSGLNELLCRCGLAFNGPPGNDVLTNEAGEEVASTPITLHGKVANRPAHFVKMEVTSENQGTLSVTGVVDETSLFGPCLRLESRIETEAGSNRLTVHDKITNLGGQTAELQLIYHTNIGPPLLQPSSEIVAPVLEVTPQTERAADGVGHWNSYEAPQAGFAEQVYFLKLAKDQDKTTSVLLKNAEGDRAVQIGFPTDELPYFTLWKNTAAEADGYVTGLEPSTNLPNFKTFERDNGRVIELPPGGTYETHVSLAVYDSKETVNLAEKAILKIQNGETPKLHASPQPGMSPQGGNASAKRPYMSQCPSCEQGLVRIAQCPACQGMVALCDECEAIWSTPESAQQGEPTSGQHPECPKCETTVEKWNFPDVSTLEKHGYGDLIAGESC